MTMDSRPQGDSGLGGARPARPYGSSGGYGSGPPSGGPSGPGGPPRRGPAGPRPRGRFIPRRKVCAFCVDHADSIDYKNYGMLRRYLSDRAKVEPRRKTGTCARHQRLLSTALERARHIALLPFTSDQVQQPPARYGSSYGGQSYGTPREAPSRAPAAASAPAATAAGGEA